MAAGGGVLSRSEKYKRPGLGGEQRREGALSYSGEKGEDPSGRRRF